MDDQIQKKDEDISFWAKLFYMAIIRQHTEFARLTIDDDVMREPIKDVVVAMFNDIFTDKYAEKYPIGDEYPGDEAMIGLDGLNKEKADWNRFKIIIFKRVCEKIGRVITYQEFTLYYHIFVNHITSDDKVEGKSKWHKVIEMLDIPPEYVPIDLKSIIAKSNEELNALKMIDKYVNGMENINGLTFTFESYFKHADVEMRKMGEELYGQGMYNMINLDVAPLYAMAIKIGLMPERVLYTVVGPEFMTIPPDVLEGILRNMWEQGVDGNGEIKGKVFNMPPLFFRSFNSEQPGDTNGEEGGSDEEPGDEEEGS